MINRITMAWPLFGFSFLLLFIVFASSFSASALEIRAQGSNQRQAVNAALRQAVEMSLGTQVETNTLVENFQVVRQQILNHTKGFVRSYRVLSQSTSANGVVSVVIDALVDDKSIKDSTRALATLMKMAAHPRVYVAGIDTDFDALSSLNDEFRILNEAVEDTLRDEFNFEVLDSEAIRLNDRDKYRFTDRKNNLKRARHAKAAFVIFIEVLKSPNRRGSDLTLRLETIEIASNRSISKENISFSMADWTRVEKNNQDAIINEAKDHIYVPSTLIAAAMVETLRKEVYEEGQRFEVSFSQFEEKQLKFLETDLASLSGYVRHQLQSQKKNALSLSYWSLLKAGPLHEEITSLLKRQDVTFNFQVRGRTLTYRFDDPMFE